MYVGINNFLGCWIHEYELYILWILSEDVYINEGLFKINIFFICMFVFGNNLWDSWWNKSRKYCFGSKDMRIWEYKVTLKFARK